MLFHPSRQLLLAAAAAGGFAVSAQADLIVDFGGDYVSNNQDSQQPKETVTGDFDGEGDDPDIAAQRLSLTGPSNPTIGANYNGTSAVFYGGVQTVRFDSSSASGLQNNFRIDENGSNDRVEFQYGSNGLFGGTDQFDTAAGLVYWTNFIGGGSYTLNDINSIRVAGAAASGQTARYVVIADGNFYTSTTDDSFFGFDNTITNAEIKSKSWNLYDPDSRLSPESEDFNVTFDGT